VNEVGVVLICSVDRSVVYVDSTFRARDALDLMRALWRTVVAELFALF
jgi:hypothetical protein